MQPVYYYIKFSVNFLVHTKHRFSSKNENFWRLIFCWLKSLYTTLIIFCQISTDYYPEYISIKIDKQWYDFSQTIISIFRICPAQVPHSKFTHEVKFIISKTILSASYNLHHTILLCPRRSRHKYFWLYLSRRKTFGWSI